MRNLTSKPYLIPLIAILLLLVAWSTDEIYRLSGHDFHQRIFGFTLKLPKEWHVEDEGEISSSGDYMINLGKRSDEDPNLYLCFFPVKGLSLIEFANETLMEISLTDKIELREEDYGDLDCLVYSQSISNDPSIKFPLITTIFGRIGDNYLRAFFISGDEESHDEIIALLDTIKVADELRETSFLSVKNYWNYGTPETVEEYDDLHTYINDPELLIEITALDGSERMIFDDFAYPARFPEGEVSDEYGYRTQFYEDGRYFVDNRKKIMDVYIPDIKMDVSDFHMSVEMRFEGGHPVKGNGIVFRGSESGFYLFDLSPDGFYALYEFNGEFETLIEKTFIESAIQFEDNRINLDVRDNVISLTVNDQKTTAFNLSDGLPSGFLGLYVCAGSYVSFDNYYVEIYD